MDARTVLLAPDKFKGCLTASEVADALATGIRDVSAAVRIRTVPVADGGDGTVAALLARGWAPLDVAVTGPDGERVVARTAVRGGTAVVESAATSGLRLLQTRGLRPLTAGSRGVGEAIGVAVEAGARHVVVGVGGTACTDGGAGMLAALGARVLDGRGRPVPDGGAGLADVVTVDLGPARERLAGVELTVATDVDNPLVGRDGAAAVYGPQKGATAADVVLLDDALRRWSQAVGASPDLPGAGAGGGLAYGLVAGLGGAVRSGVDLVLELVGFAEEVATADLVVTGEGCLDEQSLRGKAVVGVVRAAGGATGPRSGATGPRSGAVPPVVAVCGVNRLDAATTQRIGLSRVWSLLDRAESPVDSMTRAPELLREVGRELVELLGSPAPQV